MTTLITLAATQAVITGQESIDRALIDSVVYHGPTERRRLFERTLA